MNKCQLDSSSISNRSRDPRCAAQGELRPTIELERKKKLVRGANPQTSERRLRFPESD
jgi:hypothetical protein